MIAVRPSGERGRSHFDWLDSRHTFSFGDYHDPGHMGFRALRVINEDWVAPGTGFPTHPHRDMEIITYVLDGAVEHRDTMGNATLIQAGEVQRMTAGTGVRHSEHNASMDETLHLVQIWILPEREGLAPSYEQRSFPAAERRGRLCRVASRDGEDGALTVHQDVALYSSLLDSPESVTHELRPGRHAWVQVARGSVALNGIQLEAGDGATLSEERGIELRALESGGNSSARPGVKSVAEVLLFDLA